MSNFDGIETYKDLCKEIDILTIRKEELTQELAVLNRRIMSAGPRTKLVASYTGMPGGGSSDKQWEVYGAAQVYKAVRESLDDVSEILTVKLHAKKRIESTMEQFECLEYKVAYMRDIERMPIAKIASKLGYSYDWIAKISSKVKRMRQAG